MPLTKEKKKLHKLIQQSDSDDSEHELSHYVNDRVKLMKEVLKTIKPKKIRAMAPAPLKNVDMEEINSMLLEELLGISNKRLKYIFNGQSVDEDSSSSTNEEESIDVISLDDISDDEFIINIDDDTDENKSKLKKVKKEHKHCRVKKEKGVVKKEKSSKNKEKHDDKNEKLTTEVPGSESVGSSKNLMSVLELLELQARARAIKSQLLLENAKTQESISAAKTTTNEEKEGSDDDVIIEATKAVQIIITSSESEDETKDKKKKRKKEKHQDSLDQTILETCKDLGSVEENENVLKETEDVQLQDQGSKKENAVSITNNTNKSDNHVDSEAELKKSESNETAKIKIIENKEILIAEENLNKNNEISKDEDIRHRENIIEKNNISETQASVTVEKEKNGFIKAEKPVDNDEIIVINLSDDEIDELK